MTTNAKRQDYKDRLLLNQKEFAAVIGRSVPIARELMNKPGFPSVMVGGHRLVVVSALDDYFRAQVAKGCDGD